MCAICLSLHYHNLTSVLESHELIHFILVLIICYCSSLRSISLSYLCSKIPIFNEDCISSA